MNPAEMETLPSALTFTCLAAAVLALVLAMAGCSDSDGATTASDATEQRVIDVLRGYYAAQNHGDATRACDYLTPARQAELIRVVNQLPSNGHLTSCDDALASILDAPGGRVLVRNVQINEVEVSGDSATAKASSTSSNGKSIATTDYRLTKASAGWKISPGSGSTTIRPTTLVQP
jgi:hypothetical protein